MSTATADLRKPGDEAVEVLQMLRPGGPWNLVAMEPDGKPIGKYCTSDVEARAFVNEHAGSRNIYYGINPWRGMSTKAKKDDVATIEYVQADLDPRKNEPAEAAKARFREALAALRIEPTAVVYSGNGLQALWRLDEPLAPENFSNAEAASKALMKALGSGDASCFNVDRIFRVPGTTNLPNAKKRAEGREPREAKLVHFNGSKHPLSALDTIGEARIDDDGNLRRYDYDRSRALYALIMKMLRLGAEAEGIWEHIRQLPSDHPIAQHVADQGGDPRAYVDRQVERAKEKIGPILPPIQIVPGQIGRGVRSAMAALIAAGQPVFVRAGALVKPVWAEMPTADGRTTEVIVFRSMTAANLAVMLTEHAATFTKYDGRSKKPIPIDPPGSVLQGLLQLGEWDFPHVAGIINAPTMRHDGTVISEPGYDPSTALWYWPDKHFVLPPVAAEPTRTTQQRHWAS